VGVEQGRLKSTSVFILLYLTFHLPLTVRSLEAARTDCKTASSFLQAVREGAKAVQQQGGGSKLQRGRSKLVAHVVDGLVRGC
jgi:hypothetical protein